MVTPTKKTKLSLLMCSILLSPGLAYATNWKPILLQGSKNYRSAKDMIKINIPASVSEAALKTLKVEVDNVDVTSQIKIVGHTIQYKPLQPLTKGFHNVRLVEFAKDGNINERGTWKFEVRKSQLFRDSSYSINTDLTVTRPVSEKNITLDGKKTTGNGTIAITGSAANKNWKFTSSLNTIYDSKQVGGTGNKRFDMTDYLFTGDASRTGFKIGHHGTTVNNMLINGYNSRGVSVVNKSADGRIVLNGFSMRSQTITGFRNGLGVSRGENRTSGVYGQFFPNKTNPDRLSINVAYVDGKCQGTGAAVSGGDCEASLVKQGKGYSISADSKSKNSRWRLRGEFAATRFDIDGVGVGFDAENDNAWSLLSAYTAKQKMIGKHALNWNISLEHKRVGRNFITITNSGIPRDKLVTRAVHTLTYKGMNLTTNIGTETDNVDDDPKYTHVRTNIFSTTLNWTPLQNNTGASKSKKKKFSFFAQPTYTLSYSNTGHSTKKTPVGYTGIAPDDITDVVLLNASFTPGKWNWSFGHTYTLSNDDSNNALVSRDNKTTNATTLNITYPITDKFALGPSLHYNTIENRASNVDTNNTTISLNATFAWKTKLTGSLNYSFVNNDTSDNSGDSTSHSTDLELSWSLREAKNNRPGASWFVRGNWNNLDTSADNYQIHTGIKIGWPITR